MFPFPEQFLDVGLHSPVLVLLCLQLDLLEQFEVRVATDANVVLDLLEGCALK